MKKIILFILCCFAFSTTNAQGGFEGYLLANDSDRTKLINSYLNPAMKGLIYGMNSGWYHTAKVHKTLGFDISVGLNASLPPTVDETFTLNGLKSINNGTGNSITAATIAGSEDTRPLTTVNFTNNNITYTQTFNAPGGIKEALPLNAIPTPAVQLNLGLPSKFELNLRFVPEVGSNDIKGNLFGLGLKKEITSWFGPIDKLPFLHVSLLATYTSMNVNYTIENSQNIKASNGVTEFKLNSYTAQAIASLNFPIINVYGGIGYGSGSSSIKMLGDYTASYIGQSRTITDPINSKFNAGSFRATLGTRLSLGFFKLFGSYTLQEYNTANLGIAISIR